MKLLKTAFFCLVCTGSPWLHAQSTSQQSRLEQAYQSDLAACWTAPPTTDRTACQREARHALAEQRRGRLDHGPDAQQLARNALARCEVHQGEDRAHCIARIQGQGTVQGSVESGGLLRSLTITR